MKRFIEGEDRQQVTLLPECLDDYIAEANPVRVVDVFVESWIFWHSVSVGSIRQSLVDTRTTRLYSSSSTTTGT